MVENIEMAVGFADAAVEAESMGMTVAAAAAEIAAEEASETSRKVEHSIEGDQMSQ